MEKLILNGYDLTLDQVIEVSRDYREVDLSDAARDRIINSRKLVDEFVNEDKVVYGITTGFGKFAEVKIPEEQTKELQRNLIMSHSCGVGKPLSKDMSRAALLLRANALAKGFSGIRLSTIETMIDMLNKDITPIIPEKGSLGSSGDLAPLAHMVQPMLGLGECMYRGEKMESKKAMGLADIAIVELTSKEGLALINGTQIMTAVGAVVLYDAINVSKISDIAGALTMEALGGIIDAFDTRIAQLRLHKGQMATSENFLKLLGDSENVTRQGDVRVQDSYTLRCIPQVHAASKDCFRYVKEKVEIEINSVTDNPLIFPDDGMVISGGNFHGQPMALPFDYLGIGISELGNISERRIEKLVNPALSHGLPAFLVKHGGLNSGFMIVQYSAASLVSENKILAHPASVDSIPSSANQEDHVSMGTIAARKARDILFNVRKILAMEILAAVQAIDLQDRYANLSKTSKVCYDLIRNKVEFLERDRVMNLDIEKVDEMLKDESLIKAVEEIIGNINI